ncbi:MAG: hypothetical protein GZ091_09130 [Paludibacter sp.]|nr:hypothetical protein [Paludibacter sp.]
MKTEELKSVAIIVTHPDEETLWAGGTILSHPLWNCFVVCLTKANDPELAPRFYNALKVLKAEGVMGNLEEITDSNPTKELELDRNIVQLLPNTHFDIIITHNSFEENPDNHEHEAVNKAVIRLWQDGIIAADELWTFANIEGNMKYYPKSLEQPEVLEQLSKHVWSRKYNIITRIFGFKEKSWEAITTPLTESFWKYKNTNAQKKPVKPFGYSLNIFRAPSIEVLKFLYHKSVAFSYDKSYWKFEESSISDTFEKLNENEPVKTTNKYWGKDLSIFNTPSIDYLKTLYYKSISFFFESNVSKSESSYFDYSFREGSENIHSQKRSFRKLGKELKIFKTPSIESLKTMYSKSVAFVFEKNRLEPEIALFSEENNSRNDITLNQLEKELNIFNTPTIESLKRLYSKNTRKD